MRPTRGLVVVGCGGGRGLRIGVWGGVYARPGVGGQTVGVGWWLGGGCGVWCEFY